MNQCSRAIVRNVINKVVVGCSPKNQESISKDQLGTTDGQANESKEDDTERKMKLENEDSAFNVQNAFIDNSATNFINPVSSNIDDDNAKRYDFKFLIPYIIKYFYIIDETKLILISTMNISETKIPLNFNFFITSEKILRS